MKRMVFSAVLLSMTLLCPVQADDLIPLTLDYYQAETYAYTTAGSSTDSDNDTSFNQSCYSEASSWGIEYQYWCGPQVKYVTLHKSSTMESSVTSSSINGVLAGTVLNGNGTTMLQDDCNPNNSYYRTGGGSGNGYASLQGTLSVGQFPGYPPGTAGVILQVTAQVDGNTSADWTSHTWWLKIWDQDPNAPLAIIDPNNMSAEISASSGDIFNIKLYQTGQEDEWPENGLSTTVDVNFNLVLVPSLADRNSDSFVNFLDYAIFANDWKQTPDPCDPNNNDITKDGQIDIYDLAQLVEYWLACFVTEATNPEPADHAVNVNRNLILQWSPGDNSISHDVYFGTEFNEVNDTDTTNANVYMGNQDVNYWDTNNYDANGLQYGSTYYWRIDGVAGCTAKGDVWSFTTVPLPGQASNLNPANGVTDVNITTDLSWTAGSDATSHDVYFGTTNPPPFRGNQTGTTYDTGAMDINTTYYWRIDEKNANGTTTGNVWSFTTVPLPGQASNPNPANGVADVNITTDLSWTAGSFATSHDVYFGTTNPPPFRGNQTSRSYDTGTMDVNTTYYWQIDEKNTSGITTGILWNFTTGTGGEINDVNFVSWWKCDEGTGTIAYDSAGTNNGTISGATWTTGKIVGALSFDGTNDYVNCGSGPSNYDNITVSAWMNTSTKGALVSNRDSAGSYGTWYTLTSTSIEIGDNSQGGFRNLTFYTPTLDSLWHRVVYTKDGVNHAIYVDGSLDQQFTSNADISQNSPLFIGRRWTRSNDPYWFNGTIDDVRIYSRALSAEEVALLYQQGQ